MFENSEVYDIQLNRVLKMYNDAAKNEKNFILNTQFRIETEQSILLIDCGLSSARHFSPSVKISCGEEVLSFDREEWPYFIRMMENAQIGELTREFDVTVLRECEERELIFVSKWNNNIYFSKRDVMELLKLNSVITSRLEMLRNIDFTSYYYKFMMIVKDICADNVDSIEDVIRGYCDINITVQSYAMIECLYFIKQKVLNDVNSP